MVSGMNLAKLQSYFTIPWMLVEKLPSLGCLGRFCRLGFVLVFLVPENNHFKMHEWNWWFPRISYVKNWFIIQLILIANHFFHWMAMRFQVKVKQQRSQHLKGLTHVWCDFPSNFQMESIIYLKSYHFATLFNASKTCVASELCCGGISLYSPWQRGGGPAACGARDIWKSGCTRLAVAKIRMRGYWKGPKSIQHHHFWIYIRHHIISYMQKTYFKWGFCGTSFKNPENSPNWTVDSRCQKLPTKTLSSNLFDPKIRTQPLM